LIGLLVAVIALGLVFYFHNTSNQGNEARANAAPPIAIAPPAGRPRRRTPAPAVEAEASR